MKNKIIKFEEPMEYKPKEQFFDELDLSFLKEVPDDIDGYAMLYKAENILCHKSCAAFLRRSPELYETKKGISSAWNMYITCSKNLNNIDNDIKFSNNLCFGVYCITPDFHGKLVPFISPICIDCTKCGEDVCVERNMTIYKEGTLVKESGITCVVRSVHNNCKLSKLKRVAVTAIRDFRNLILESKKPIECNIVKSEEPTILKQDKTKQVTTQDCLQKDEKQIKPVKPRKKKQFSINDKGNGNYTIRFAYQGKIKSRNIKADSLQDAEFIAGEVVNLLTQVGYKSDCLKAKEIVIKYTGDLSEYEELLSIADDEISSLKNEVSRLQNELYNKNNIIEMLTNKNDIITEDSSEFKELFDGEILYHLHKVVEQHINSIVDDSNNGLRQREILKYFNSLPYTDIKSKIKEQLTHIMSVNPSSSQFTNLLNSIGFECIDTGSGHKKIFPIGHEEYGSVVPCTPSDDNRGTKNTVKNILKVLF